MEFSIQLHAKQPGWYIVNIEGSQVIIAQTIEFLSLKVDFDLANNTKFSYQRLLDVSINGLFIAIQCL